MTAHRKPAHGAQPKKGKGPRQKAEGKTPRRPVNDKATPPPEPRPGSREAQRVETERQQAVFLETYRKVGSVLGACRTAGVGRRTHYDWLQTSPAYAAAFADAKDDAADMLEQEARRRAVAGTERPVFGPIRNAKGGIIRHAQIGVIREYSDTLLIALLNANRPEKFKFRHEHSGPKGGPIQTQHTARVVITLPDNGRKRTR